MQHFNNHLQGQATKKMMWTGVVLMLFFVSTLASISNSNEDVRNLASHQKKLLRDYFHLQNYLNAEGMKKYLPELQYYLDIHTILVPNIMFDVSSILELPVFWIVLLIG